jgi:hypothetical protein
MLRFQNYDCTPWLQNSHYRIGYLARESFLNLWSLGKNISDPR